MTYDAFDKWEDFENSNSNNELYKEQFKDFISFESRLKEALKKPFEYLLSDIIFPQKITHNFKELFTKYPTNYDIYDVLEDDSSCCVAINPKMRQVDARLFPNWLDNTLKVADHLVTYYIQIYLSLAFKAEGKHGTETSRYIQLQRQSCPHVKYAGFMLEDIYKSRNLHSHRTIEIAGEIVIQKINRHEMKRKNIINFEKAFSKLQLAFTDAYPAYKIS